MNNLKQDNFITGESIGWEAVAPGMKRKIMAYDDRAMLVKVAFERGSVGTLHHHYHSQISYVESGVFEVEISKEKKLLKAGDVFYAPPDEIHGVVCMEEGVLIDMFSPHREDFIGNAP